jgi:16S rRNA (guanine1207-N2)-methyltransferase
MVDHRDTALLALPADPGRVLVLNAQPLPVGALRDAVCEQGFRPDFLALEQVGYDVSPRVEEGGFDSAIVLIHRSRVLNEVLIARAHNAVREGGAVVVAGPVKSSVKALRKWVGTRAQIADSFAKHHAVAFRFVATGADWPVPDLAERAEDFITSAGTFSADRLDKGSVLLARHFGPHLRGCVADFGAGWGYLSAELMKVAPEVGSLALYEADHAALGCARENLAPWAQVADFKWMDVPAEFGDAQFNHVIMNPPFHTDRAADTALGQAFIQAAARALMPGGSLLMVANRNLPYETVLEGAFKRYERLADEQGFKVIEAFV